MEDKDMLKPENLYSAHVTGLENATHNDKLTKFNARQGHGYAAEPANDMLDKLHGKNSIIVGDNNAKNGPDRMVDGQLIQTKYCQTAAESVNAAFRNGVYRYYDANGTPMQLEVPNDQYVDAVKTMQKRISEGKVPGITDPAQAKNLIRQGNIDYKTACNIAKAGNIDSLLFDASHGAVIAANALGISATITFAKAIWDGESPEKAIDMAVFNGLKFGGVAFVSSVISAQVTRTSINRSLRPFSVTVVNKLPIGVRKELVAIMKSGAKIYGGAATNNLAKLLRSNIITEAVMVLVMSAGDINNYFKGKISGKQLFKVMATLGAGLTGGGLGYYCGAVIGSGVATIFFGPGAAEIGAEVGSAVGSMAGGVAAGSGANKALNEFIEDDAVEMVRIINRRFIPLAQEYLLNEEETDLVLEDLKKELEQGSLLDMFASSDREYFADNMLRRIIDKRIILQRPAISIPSDKEYYEGMLRVIAMAGRNEDLQKYFTKKKIDPQQIAKQLMPEKDISDRSAKNAWYSTKNMNAVLTQQEMSLQSMLYNEKSYREKSEENRIELEKLKKEVKDLLKKDE